MGSNIVLEDLFTSEEIEENAEKIRLLNEEFNQLNRLDKQDIILCLSAGILGAMIDILLVGIPAKTSTGIKAGPLSDFIRNYFDQKFPDNEMGKLAGSRISKVPYDAQDNRHTTIHVEGLSAYYHRLLSLGHDPFLGFLFGITDILNGTMTAID